jgi:tetratricopeptide (TPR) repeat protein
MVFQDQSKAEAAAAFAAARKALADLPRSGLDTARLDFLLALLDLHESRLHAARGDETRALEQLMRATQLLNTVSGQRPDAAVLRSELASSHLSSATILEGIDNPSDALEVRALALSELEKAIEQHPDAPEIHRGLAAAQTAMAEAAVLSGEADSAAPHIAAAEKRLAVLPASPASATGDAVLKATLLGLRAGILRDRGNPDEAMALYEEGIRTLEGIRAAAGSDPLPAYRLALLWWQKARLLGDSGKRAEEIEWLGRARDLLGSLVRDDAVSGPLPEQILRTSAYLAGDLGHALQIANRKGDAARAFDSAVSLWEKLTALRPDRGEYQEGLTWSRQRREELK